jgi:hypothetical protein
VRKEVPVLPLILSSDSHVFEPPDLWQTRIDAAFRDRAPRIERIDGADQIVVEADQILSGIGLISNAGARFEAPETISGQGRLEDVQRGGYDPEQHLKDMALDGVAGEVLFERHPRLTLAIVEFELAWVPHLLSTMDYTYRERHGEAIYRFKDRMRPSDFFHRNVVLSFQEDAIGVRLRDVIGVDNMMWGSDYPHSESTFPQSRKILADILAGVPHDEQAKIAGGNTARVYRFDLPKLGARRRS